jgi:hypothetical protein
MPCVPLHRYVARVFALIACFALALVVLGTGDVAEAAEGGGVAVERAGELPAPDLAQESAESEDDDDASDVPHAASSRHADRFAASTSSVASVEPRHLSIANRLGRGPPQRG